MLPHDELYHYGVPGMRWGIRRMEVTRGATDKRMTIKEDRIGSRAWKQKHLQKERDASVRNHRDFNAGKIGDKEYSRRERAIRQQMKAKVRTAKVAAVDAQRRSEAKALKSMPNTQRKADKVVGKVISEQGMFATRSAAKEARLKALGKNGFDKKQASRGLRSYEFAMYGMSAGLMAMSVASTAMIKKGKGYAGILDYVIAAGAGAAVGRGVASAVAKKKGEPKLAYQ